MVFKGLRVSVNGHGHVGVGGNDDRCGFRLLRGLHFWSTHTAEPPGWPRPTPRLWPPSCPPPTKSPSCPHNHGEKVLAGPVDAPIKGHSMGSSHHNAGLSRGRRSKEPDGVPLARLTPAPAQHHGAGVGRAAAMEVKDAADAVVLDALAVRNRPGGPRPWWSGPRFGRRCPEPTCFASGHRPSRCKRYRIPASPESVAL